MKLKMILERGVFIASLYILFSFKLFSQEIDTMRIIANIENSDVNFYNLYKDYYTKDKYKAIQYAELYLSGIADLKNNIEKQVIADLYRNVSEFYEQKFIYSKAISFFEKGLEITYGLMDEEEQAKADFRLATLNYKINQIYNCLKYNSKAYRYYALHNDTISMMKCYNLYGAIYNMCGRHDDANKIFDKYAQYANMIDNQEVKIKALSNMATARVLLNDTLKAVSLFEECVEMSESSLNERLILYTSFNLASAYIHFNMYDKALNDLHKLNPLLKSVEDNGCHALISGTAYYNMGDLTTSAIFFKKSLFFLEQGEFPSFMLVCLNYLKNIYIETEDYENADDINNKIIGILSSINASIYTAQLEYFLNETEIKKENTGVSAENRILRLALYVLSSLLLILLVVNIFLAGYKSKKEKEYRINHIDNELKKVHEVQKSNQLMQVLSQIESLEALTTDDNIKNKLTDVIYNLNGVLNNDNLIAELKMYVPKFNERFLQLLLLDFPDLSLNERRLCALLDMNLSTKEISDITRQSMQSINVARCRLRKKLGINGKNISIQEFLSKYK